MAEVEHWYRHRTDIEALNKQGRQTRCRATPPALSEPADQHRVDVGRPARLRDRRLDPRTRRHRPRQRPWPVHRGPVPPRNHPHPRPPDPASRHHLAPPTTRRSPAGLRATTPASTTRPQRLTRHSPHPPTTPRPRGRNLRPTPRQAAITRARHRKPSRSQTRQRRINPENRLLADSGLSMSHKRVVRLTPALDMPRDLFDKMFDRIDRFAEDTSTSAHLLTSLPPNRLAKIAAFAANGP